MKLFWSFLALMFLTANASAALIVTDWSVADDSLITRDTNTGLEWLDWSVTTERSYADVSAKFGPDEEFDGFRYATNSEVVTLFVDSMGAGAVDAGETPLNAAAALLFDFTIGRTATQGTGGDFLGRGITDHLTFPSPGTGFHWWANVQTALNASTARMHSRSNFLNDNSTSPTLGHALVRPVPIPSSMLLFGSGLVGLIVYKYRRRSQSV